MKKLRVGIIYLITYPNGKIYIGQDRTDDINYFGSACSFMIAKDFNKKERMNFTVKKQIVEYKKHITIKELNVLERKWIQQYNSNDPDVGYNRTGTPRQKCTEVWER
jgi:hypothetical protein